MLTIRLQRSGKKHKPSFRIVLAESREHVSKKFQEILGSYNPRTKEFVVKSEERLKYWISQHIQLSPTVHNLFVSKNIITEPKVKAFSIPKKASTSAEASPSAKSTEDETADKEEKKEESPAPEAKAETPSEPEPVTVVETETAATETPAENV